MGGHASGGLLSGVRSAFAHASLTLLQSCCHRPTATVLTQDNKAAGGFQKPWGMYSKDTPKSRAEDVTPTGRNGSPLGVGVADAGTLPSCDLPASSLIVCGGGARENNPVAWRTEVTLTQPHVAERGAQLLGSLSGNVRKKSWGFHSAGGVRRKQPRVSR